MPDESFPEPCARSAFPPPRPSTAPASCLTKSLARRPRSWAAGLAATAYGNAAAVTLGDQRDHRRVAAELSADVADQRAQIGGRHPGRHPLRHQTDVTDVLRSGGGVCRSRPRVRQPVTFDFLLGGLQPLHQVRHPGRHLVGRHLQRRGQSGHQRALLGQMLERLQPDVSLDPAHAGAHRRFAENGHRPDLRRVVHVRSTAQLQ